MNRTRCALSMAVVLGATLTLGLFSLRAFAADAPPPAAPPAPAGAPAAAPAAAATPPAAPTKLEPVGLKEDKDINSGDTAWMLASAALVLMMTGPGLALFYGGLVRRKNVLATMMQSFICMCVVSMLWAVVGYSLAFDVGNPFIGGFRFALLNDVGTKPSEYGATIPHTTWMVYQLMFAIITPGLICGAYAERMKFSAMLIFTSLWLLVVYCPLAHMVWGKGGLFNAFLPDPAGPSIPVFDFAGGTVVHISSGISALVCALVLKHRLGYGKTPMPPHSLVISVIGACLLWVGWFGFNGGSAVASNGLASSAFCNTHFAAAAAALGWIFAEWIKSGKPTVLGGISGAVAGLVVITPASGFVTILWAIVMGFAGGVICMLACSKLKPIFNYDDSLDAFGVHGVGGTLGALLTGVFATAVINPGITSPEILSNPAKLAEFLKTGSVVKGGLVDGFAGQVLNQAMAAGVTWGIAIVGSIVLLKIVDVTVGLRVSESDEMDGLDLSQHGESGYIMDASEGTVAVAGTASHASHAAMTSAPLSQKRS